VCGIVTGIRSVITKARATMAVVTMEDLQGTIEIIVFPRTYEETAGTWVEGAILLVAGRVDHRGEETSLLADLVVPWEAASALGPDAFARQVATGDRGRGPRRSGGWANGNGGAHGSATTAAVRTSAGPGAPGMIGEAPAIGPGRAATAVVDAPTVDAPVGERPATGQTVPSQPVVGGRTLLRVSPLRPEVRPAEFSGPYGTAVDPFLATVEASASEPIAPAEPVPTYLEPAGLTLPAGERDDEPPLPDEARERMVDGTASPTAPVEAGPGRVLHVHFNATAGTERLVGAMEEVRSVLRERPGSTRVVVHLPQSSGRDALQMELRSGVAYDVDLLAEVTRRLATGVVELRLA
jgi:hypothetical protein